MKIEAMSYEQCRKEYFERQIEKYEKRLKWWKCQKPYKQYSRIMIDGECSDCGIKISFYKDALKALEG